MYALSYVHGIILSSAFCILHFSLQVYQTTNVEEHNHNINTT